jgi:hypothetical protein
MKSLLSFGSLLTAGMLTPAFACSPSPTESTQDACVSFDAQSPQKACGSYDTVIAMTDYASSEVGLISLAGASDSASGTDLGRDPALASSAGRHFWIARDLGQIIELDTRCLHAIGTFDALDAAPAGATPKPTNPYDVAVAPDGSLWIARLDVPTVLVLNACGTRRMTIDLSSEDEEDGNPNMNSIKILDPAQPNATGTMATSKAYVSLEILDDRNVQHPLISTRKSKLVRIDLETGKVEDTLVLAGRNPLSSMVQLGSQLYLADAGTWEDPNGQPDTGVEVVDTASFTSKLLVNGVALGGHASEVAVTANCGVVIVAGAWPETPTALLQFDPTTIASAPLGTLIPTTRSFTLAGLAWIGSEVLLVGDSGPTGGTPGVRIFDAKVSAGCSFSQRPSELPLPLAPVGFAGLR